MKTLLGVFLLLSTATCFGQTSSSDGQVLQAILAELQSMHAEIRTQSARTQTMQVLLFELQNQQGVLTRATQSAEAARTRSTDTQEAVRRVFSDIAQAESSVNSAANDADKARLESQVERMKSGLILIRKTEQDRATEQQQAEAQLQKAQSTYDAIQDELNAFMKTLQQAGSR